MSIIQQGKKKLNHKFSIVIFPEGTRTSIGETGKYKLSGAYLAKETETPIIPIAHNSGSHWLRKSFFKKPGIITISIGHAIYPQNLTTTELNETTKNWIEDEMRRIDPYVYNNEKKTTNIP